MSFFEITRDDLIEGGIAALLNKVTELVVRTCADKIAADEKDPAKMDAVRKLALDFFSNEKLGKSLIKTASAAAMDAACAASPSWGENKYVKMIRKELRIGGMSDGMEFAMGNLIGIGKTLVPNLLKIGLPEEAKKVKTKIVDHKKSADELSMDDL